MSADTPLLNNRYQLLAQQGSGGMAVIYKAVDLVLGRTVAIKILRPSLTPDPTFITRFQNEARSIANLAHPNIVTVYDVGHDEKTHYIVMEFVDGRDLKKLIREYGALPVDHAIDLAIGICAGLGFAHRAGLVHADVKPQNILLNKDNQVKITDFGIAQALSDSQPSRRESVVWGSPHYFAPEQAQGERPSAASDVYSIGVVIFEMLTGKLPYSGANQQELAMAHIRAPIPKVTDFNPAVPDGLSQIVYKVMSKSPDDRYRMADQLGHVLVSFRDKLRLQKSMPDPSPGIATVKTPSPGQSSVVQPPPVQQRPPEKQPDVIPPKTSGTPPYGMPTQRVNTAPEAPSTPGYGRPTGAAKSDSRPYPPPPPAIPSVQGDSRPFAPRYPHSLRGEQGYAAQNELRPLFDSVTIALAFLAFMSVACLIPLYVAVLLARA